MKTNLKKKSRMVDDEVSRQMKAELERIENKKSGGGGGSMEGWHIFEAGKNRGRVLPRGKYDKTLGRFNRPFYIKRRVHGAFNGIGPNAVKMSCSADETVPKDKRLPCLVDKKFKTEVDKINRKYKRGDTRGQEAWRDAKNEYGYNDRYFFLWLPFDEDTGKLSRKPVAVECGEQVITGLIREWHDSENCGDFTHPKTGRTMTITKTEGKGKGAAAKNGTSYSVRASSSESSIFPLWEKIREKLPSLEKMINARYPVLSVKAQRAALEGTDDDLDEEESDDDDAEKTRSSKKTIKKNRKPLPPQKRRLLENSSRSFRDDDDEDDVDF